MALLCGRWDTDGTSKYDDTAFNNPENVGVNWRVDSFGTQRIEVLVKARNKLDQYDRYKNHLGQRLAVYGSEVYRPIVGFITNIEYAGAGRVLYTAKGPGACRMEDALDTTVYASATGLDNLIETVLTDHVSVSSSDQSNIDNNTTTSGGWQPAHPQGSYPHEIIRELLAMSDSSGNIWDFWFLDMPFSGVTLQDWLPYYKARSTAASADWVVYSRDMVRQTVARDINDIATSASVYYGTITGTHDGSNNSSATLTDSTATFRASGVKPGDSIANLTDASRSKVTYINSPQTSLVFDGLSGGTENDFDTSDTYAIELQNPKSVQTDTDTTQYWARAVAASESAMTSTQATQYAAILADSEARQVQSFTLGAKSIEDGKGARFPLWEVIAQGGGYIRWADMYPAAAQFSTSLDKATTFFITGLDYDYARNTLAVTLDHPSRRLDARLRRAGILNSELVQRSG